MAERKDINSPAAFGKRFEKRDRVPGMTDHGPLAVGEVELWPGMKVISMEEQRQIFSWNDGLGTGPGHDWVFDVTSLRNAIHNGTVRSTIINMPVDQEVYDYLMKKRGVEEDRVKALEPIDLADPAICLLMFRPDIEEWVPLTIDGSHRIARRYLEGVPYCQAYLVEPPHYKDYMAVEGTEAVFFERFPDVSTS
jgi:hypothetical protein